MYPMNSSLQSEGVEIRKIYETLPATDRESSTGMVHVIDEDGEDTSFLRRLF